VLTEGSERSPLGMPKQVRATYVPQR